MTWEKQKMLTKIKTSQQRKNKKERKGEKGKT